MADETKTGPDGRLPGKDSNAHVSTAARMAEASKGSITDGPGDDELQAIRDEQEGRAKLTQAAQDAAPTGKDIPSMAAENIVGTQTAHNPDAPTKDSGNSAAQTEPALIGKDGGSIPHGFVPSPTGLVPASAVGSPAAALARHSQMLKGEAEREDLDEKTLQGMSKPEIRAVAHDRGYRVSQGGKRSIIRSFLQEQGKASAGESRELPPTKPAASANKVPG